GRRTEGSATATRRAQRSQPPRSSRRSLATATCMPWTRVTRDTASPRTSATSRRRTAPPYDGSGRARSTADRSRRCATATTWMPSSSPRRRRTRHPTERRAAWWYRLHGYRVLATNAWVAGYELDLVALRGRTVVFCEVKSKRGPRWGDPLEMVTPEKQRRV